MTYGYAISRLNPMEGIALLGQCAAPGAETDFHERPCAIFCLDIGADFGALPAGQYGMYLYLQDAYNE